MVEGYGNPHSLAHYKKACKVVANIRLKDIAAGLYRRTVLQAVSARTLAHTVHMA